MYDYTCYLALGSVLGYSKTHQEKSPCASSSGDAQMLILSLMPAYQSKEKSPCFLVIGGLQRYSLPVSNKTQIEHAP
jgi:hypothetical protein